MNVRRVVYWSLFGTCQIGGVFLPRLGTFHGSGLELFAGLLLSPGWLLFLVFNSFSKATFFATILVNFVCWYLIRRSFMQ